MCASPPRIDASYPARWSAHTAERAPGIDDVGSFVSLVNRLARRAPFAISVPVLVVHGGADELVPVDDIALWGNGRFLSPVRVGSEIRGVGEIMAVEEIKGAIQSVVRVTIEISGEDKPACVIDTISRYYPENKS